MNSVLNSVLNQETEGSNVIIRRMREEDLQQVAAIERMIFSDPWSEDGFRSALKTDGTCYLVAVISIANAPGQIDCVPLLKQENDRIKKELCRAAESDGTQIGSDIFGDIVGYCGMYTTPGEGEIVNVAVHPAFRRRGIARSLLKRLLEEGRDAQVERFILEVRRSNENAIALYEGLGFQTLGIRTGFYEHPREDAVIMCREDSPS